MILELLSECSYEFEAILADFASRLVWLCLCRRRWRRRRRQWKETFSTALMESFLFSFPFGGDRAFVIAALLEMGGDDLLVLLGHANGGNRRNETAKCNCKQ
jgi:hypothetical protein